MYIAAFDIGTSAIKTSLVSQDGRIIDSVSYRYEVISPAQKWAEQDPELWWKGACCTTRDLLERNPEARKQIAVIGVCGHMLGCIPVDSAGYALRPAMIHADTRASTEADDICKTVGRDNFYRRTGCIPGAQGTLAKILWLKRNEPEVYAKTVRFLQSKDYLAARMTGNIDTTDFSDASHAQIIDIHTKAYMTDIFAEFGLDPLKFPAIHRGIDVIGRISKTAGAELGISDGIPVIAGGGDGACANIGAGITTNRRDVYCCIGTTAWVAYNTTLPVIDDRGRVFDIMSLDGESFGVFGTMQAAGKSIDWAQKLLHIESNAAFDLEAAAAPPGSDGLIFVPYIEGERSPIFDPNARGIFFNIDSRHQRAHFARSVLEGVSYALRSILDVYRESMPIPELRLIGGGANSKLWRQILTDVCDITIRITDTHTDSVTSLGVALAAGVSAGMYTNLDEAASMVKKLETTEPLKENCSVYNRLFDTYIRLYQQVKPLYYPIDEEANNK
jgi:xylulokinase